MSGQPPDLQAYAREFFGCLLMIATVVIAACAAWFIRWLFT